MHTASPEPLALRVFDDATGDDPIVHPETTAYWDALAAGRAMLQRCVSCGILRFPIAPVCHSCLSTDWELEDIPHTGTVDVAIEVARTPPSHALYDALPYLIGLVDLTGLPRLPTRLLCRCESGLSAGMPVNACRLQTPTGIYLLAFSHECMF